jgi:hypothetical protein
MKLGLFKLLSWQWRRISEVSTFAQDLTGKVVIVTGANVGLVSTVTGHAKRADW